MGERCKDCVQIENLKEDVTRLRDDVKEIYGRLGEVETVVTRKEEQIDTIFNLLKSIQKSVDNIGESGEFTSYTKANIKGSDRYDT